VIWCLHSTAETIRLTIVTNIYWPVFKNLEKGVDELAFAIHIDDAQLKVYSSRITDLILRAAAEIESLSKELYKSNGGTKTGDIKFDDVAVKHLKTLWLLDQKKVIISSPHCFQSDRVLTPFVKNEIRTSSTTGKMTYSWNNAYQNLKHDRAQSLTFGSVKYLFDIMAALYLLNVYYKKETIPLGKDSAGINFPINLGSTLFSVELAASPSHGSTGEYIRRDGFDIATYFVNWTEESGKVFQESVDAFEAHRVNLIFQHPKLIEYVTTNDISKYQGSNLAWDVLGQDEYFRLVQQSFREVPIKSDQLEYEAVLNINAI
jgi:hypothetical protein